MLSKRRVCIRFWTPRRLPCVSLSRVVHCAHPQKPLSNMKWELTHSWMGKNHTRILFYVAHERTIAYICAHKCQTNMYCRVVVVAVWTRLEFPWRTCSETMFVFIHHVWKYEWNGCLMPLPCEGFRVIMFILISENAYHLGHDIQHSVKHQSKWKADKFLKL